MKYNEIYREQVKPAFENYCNICGYRSKFQLLNKRKNACCPVCRSLERHRHLYIHLLPLISLMRGKKILHFAPEPIFKNIFSSSSANLGYYDADLVPGRANYEVDIKNIPFHDNYFDYILASHVLEHIDDDRRAISELYRTLKPGGKAILVVPFIHQYKKGFYARTDGSVMEHLFRCDDDETFEIPGKRTPQECFDLYGQSDHLRIYGLKDFCNRLEMEKFTIEVAYIENLPEHLRKDANIIDEIIFAQK